jgi:hypothetical protein
MGRKVESIEGFSSLIDAGDQQLLNEETYGRKDIDL